LSEGILDLIDDGSFQPHNDPIGTSDRLGFPGYADQLSDLDDADGDGAVLTGSATLARFDIELAVFDFTFFGGSMGEIAGERLARAMERAAKRGVPFVLHTKTGGARMQEGMRALIQMPKVVAARLTLAASGQPMVGVLGHPTTGGVLASLAALSDVTVAEAGATIGFAGPRVAESFMGKSLSENSHRAESALAFGLVDEVVESDELQEHLATLLMTLAPDQPRATDEVSAPGGTKPNDAWEVVTAARSTERVLNHELLLETVDTMVVLRGDRAGREDPALDTAIVRIAGRKACVLALDRERAPGPGAYRKAQRVLDIAGRLGIPVVTLIDTRGADPSEDSEAGGIAWEIAQLFRAMLEVQVPTLAILTGEGGSGGALAFGCTDVLLAYEQSFFSVIGPELAAEILWRDSGRAQEAARALRLTAHDLLDLEIADELLPEPLDSGSLRATIAYHLDRLQEDPGDRAATRQRRWRNTYGDR
jgi:acyl-CoA carboxylase subunit beta